MFGLSKTVLQVSLRDWDERVLRQIDIEDHGTYHLSCDHEQLRSKRVSERDRLGGLRISWVKTSFGLDLPASCGVELGKRQLWKRQLDQACQVGFEWKKIPSGLRVRFENDYFIEFEKTRRSLSLTRSAAVWIVAVLALHALLLAFLPQSFSIEPMAMRSAPVDISQVEVRVLERPRRPQAPSAQAVQSAQRSSLDQLMSRMTAGSRVPTVEARAPTASAQAAVSESDRGRSRAGWRDRVEFADEEEETPLNLTPQELVEALQPSLPRLQECYDLALLRDSSLAGQAKLWIEFNLEGRVQKSWVQGVRSQRAASQGFLESCFQDVFAGLQVRKPNRNFLVTRTLVLSQTGEL